MYVLSKEETDKLNQEYTLAVLKQKLRKSVTMSGTAQPMPTSQPRYPSNRDWQLEAGAKQDARVEAAQAVGDSQNPQFGGAVRGEGLPAPTYSGAVMGARSESDVANPTPSFEPATQAQAPQVSWQELARLREERARAKIAHEAYLEQYNEAKKQEEERAKTEAKTRKLEAKIEELRAKSEAQELPPPAEGADPTEPIGTSGGQYDPQTEGRINPMFGGTTGRMEEPSESQLMGANPQGKIAAEPGRSGSSGVYNTGSSVISLRHVPTLQKGFQAMGHVLKTYCADCGVDVSAEGDEAHFRKTKHAHFKKI